MSSEVARKLLLRIFEEAPEVRTRLQKIGNGEMVIIVNGDYWIWSPADWEAYHARAPLAAV